MQVGRVSKIFRYPVKSMLGEELDHAALAQDGIPGDRAWGVRDEDRGDFFVGKRAAPLMSCSATYPSDAGPGAVPEIRLPDGTAFAADADAAAQRIGELVGREVTVWPASPEARERSGEIDLDEMRLLLARKEDEPLPDFSEPSPALREVYARGGPFFDAFPLLILSQRSIESIAAAAPESRVEVRRFRPSLLLETDSSERFPEQAWIGKRLHIGDAVLKVQSTCIRCVMTTHGFADLPRSPRIMRALVQHAEGNLGVYATVEQAGAVAQGAPVILEGA